LDFERQDGAWKVKKMGVELTGEIGDRGLAARAVERVALGK